MADTNLLILNQMYGIATVPTENKNLDSKNQQTIDLSQGQFQLELQQNTGKKEVLYDDIQNDKQPQVSSPSSAYAKFIGYISQDYSTSNLQKKAGYYWITQQNRSVLFFTGTQFIKYDNNTGSVKKYRIANNGTKEDPIPSYSNNIGYQMIKASVETKTILQLIFNGDVYSLGNNKEHSIQFSFNDEDNYKQLRFFDNTENYKIEYFVQSHANYIEL